MNQAYHIPVLLKETIDGLSIKPDGVYVDVTFGAGGHSLAILSKLGEFGKLIAFDQDKDALKNVAEDKRLFFANNNFIYLKNYLKYFDVDKIDGIVGDLGVSSHLFDTIGRGFSFKGNALLDMRMNQSSSFSAQEVVNEYSEDDLARLFKVYGEIKRGHSLARMIVHAREQKKITHVDDLKQAIEPITPTIGEYRFLAKVFQAIRIEVNRELENLEKLLIQLPSLLRKGGRLCFITYHSLEDRRVKYFFRTGTLQKQLEQDVYGQVRSPFRLVSTKPLLPSSEEITENSRARSAKLRIAEYISE